MNEVRSRGRRRSEGEGGDDGRAASEDEGKVEVHGSEEVDEDSHGAGVGRTTSPARERVQRMKVATTAQKVEIPRHVLAKLILFSLLMLVVPLSIFYASFKFFFHGRVSPSPILGPSTVFSSALELGNIVYSTVLAIVAVNTILFGYVLVAILEKEDGDEAGIRKKKA